MGQTWKQKAVRVQDAQPKWKQRATLVQSASDAQQQTRDLLGGTAIAELPAEFPKMNLGASSIYQQLQAGGMNMYGQQPLPQRPMGSAPQHATTYHNLSQHTAITPEMRATLNQFYADAQQQQQQRARAQAAPQPQSFGQTLGDIGRGLGRGLVAGYGSGFTAAGGLSQMAGDLAAKVTGDNALTQSLRSYGQLSSSVGGAVQMANMPAPDAGGAEQFSHALGSAIPNMASQVGIGMATGGLGLPVSLAAFATSAAAPVVGQTYAAAKADLESRGVNAAEAENKAAIEAGINGGITLATSWLPGLAILNRTPVGSSIIRKATESAIARYGIAGLSEGSQEVIEGVGQEIVKQIVRDNKDLSPEMVWEAITDPDRAMEFAVGSLLGGAARGAVEAGSLIQPAAPSPAAPQPATQSGPTAQPAAGGVGENVSGAGQDTRPETTPVAPGTQVYESGPQIAPGESAARTSPAQQARQEVAIDDLSSLNYRQLVDRAKALGILPSTEATSRPLQHAARKETSSYQSSRENLESLTYAQLRAKAKELGLDPKGTRKVLEGRIREAESRSGDADAALPTGYQPGTTTPAAQASATESRQAARATPSQTAPESTPARPSPQRTAQAAEGKSVAADEAAAGPAPQRAKEHAVTKPAVAPGEQVAVAEPEGQQERAKPATITSDVIATAPKQDVQAPAPSAVAPVQPAPDAGGKPPTITRSAGEESPPEMTSARKVDMDRDRASLGLDVLDSPDRRSWRSVLESAQKGDVTERANRLVGEVTQQPRALSDSETATLVVRGADLKNQHAAIMQKIGKATDPAEVATLSAEANRIEAEFDSLSAALRMSGTEKGRALAAQKLTINQDFELVSVLNRAKAAKGAELTAKQRAKIEALTKRLEESDAKVRQLESRIKRLTAQRAVRQTHANRFGGKPAPQAHIEAMYAKAEALLKAGCLN